MPGYNYSGKDLAQERASTAKQYTDEIDRLKDALTQAVAWIEECGSDHDGRQVVLNEARSAIRNISVAE